jgi:hypothetical protein
VYAPGAEQIGLRFWKRWILSGRETQARPEEMSTQWVLAHGWRFKATFLVSLALFLTAYVFAFVVGNSFEHDPFWKRVFFNAATLAIVALNLYLVLASFLDSVVLSESGLAIRRVLLKEFAAVWEEVSALTMNNEGDQATVRTVQGARRSFSLYFNGLGTLWSFLDRKVPREKWSQLERMLPHPYAPLE